MKTYDIDYKYVNQEDFATMRICAKGKDEAARKTVKQIAAVNDYEKGSVIIGGVREIGEGIQNVG